MESLPKDILLILLFGLPGLFIMHLIYTFTNIYRKEKYDWKKITIFSTLSIYLLHVTSIILNKFYPEKFDILNLSLKSLSSTYNGDIPVLLLTLLMSLIIAFICIININYKLIDNIYTCIRKIFNLNKKSSYSVWGEEITSIKSTFIRIITENKTQIGVLHRSSSDEKREIFLYSADIFINKKLEINKLLDTLTPEGIFIDLENDYEIEIYDYKIIKEEITNII